MLRILAIGGGELWNGETLPLDRRACELTGKRRPSALFIPTASDDAEGYIHAFARVYREIGCHVESLRLLDKPERGEITEKIRAADLIYVGGGNTLRMMQIWRRSGTDEELRRAAKRGGDLLVPLRPQRLAVVLRAEGLEVHPRRRFGPGTAAVLPALRFRASRPAAAGNAARPRRAGRGVR